MGRTHRTRRDAGTWTLALLTLAAVGCGRDGRTEDAEVRPDASVDARSDGSVAIDAARNDAVADAVAPDAPAVPDGAAQEGGTDGGASPDGPTDACMAAAERCNGIDDDCDGTVDNGPATSLCLDAPQVSMAACVEGACRVTECQYDTYDADGDYTNGCECFDDNVGRSCATGTVVGSLAPDSSVMSGVGKVPMRGGSDWYRVAFPNAGLGSPRIRLEMNEGSAFRFQVLDGSAGCPGTPLSCGGGPANADAVVEWSYGQCIGGSGGSTCGTCGGRWPSTVYVRVFRPADADSCARYQLVFSR